MSIKVVVVIIFLVILASLGTALFHLARYQNASPKIARALTVRIALSVVLIALLFVFYRLGWIQPHGLKRATMTTKPSQNTLDSSDSSMPPTR